MRRVAIIASASGNGKTTLGRQVAARLEVPFVELDALVHGPGWTETPDDELRRLVEPVVRSEGWVIDGEYLWKLGTLVLDKADTIVWLDLPRRVWIVRLLRRTIRRLASGEELWNGNRESIKAAFWGRESLFGYALRQHRLRRRTWPTLLAGHPVLRLRTPAEVERCLASTAQSSCRSAHIAQRGTRFPSRLGHERKPGRT
jgi:adenylate kinase family enzyme